MHRAREKKGRMNLHQDGLVILALAVLAHGFVSRLNNQRAVETLGWVVVVLTIALAVLAVVR